MPSTKSMSIRLAIELAAVVDGDDVGCHSDAAASASRLNRARYSPSADISPQYLERVLAGRSGMPSQVHLAHPPGSQLRTMGKPANVEPSRHGGIVTGRQGLRKRRRDHWNSARDK